MDLNVIFFISHNRRGLLEAGIQTFSIQKGHSGREVLAIRLSAEKLGMSCINETVASPGTVPIGTVEYRTPLFGKHRIDFYPEFLSGWLHRR